MMTRLPLLLAAALVAALLLYACSSKKLEPPPYSQPRVGMARERPAATLPSDAAYARQAPPAMKSDRSGGLGETGAAFSAGRAATFDTRRAEPGASFPPAGYAGEELWVIARADDLEAESTPPEPGTQYPALRAKPPGASEEVPLPLKHTDVRASVAGYIASVRVTQQYENPYDQKIEAIYVFPLPQDAAVSEFVMTIGERRIRGIIRERAEAERVYAEAKQQGYVASLLTQERPNIFTQSVANIEPGKAIDVELVYFNPLAFRDGEYEFVFPMVVGPRFNPSGSGDGIGAVPRGQYGASGQATEVHYLAPGKRSGHDIGLAVDIDAGMPMEGLSSPTHAIDTAYVSANERRVTLRQLDTVPNRDFVLRYAVAGDTVKSAFLTHRDDRGGFFTLMLQPPATLSAQARAAMELVFVLDCSGSMMGAPLDIAKQATERALRRLGPDDTFQIIQFSMSASQLGAAPLPATPANVERGIEYLQSLDSEGGTMMIEGIKAALDFPHDPRRLRVVSFMTDGYIGNEAEILGEIHRRLGDARIFSFGIGSSTNRYLLERMALMGRGAVAYVGLDEGSQRAVDAFYERVSHPALTDLTIDWNGMQVSEVYPARLPDLFVGRPVVVTGRFRGTPPAAIALNGRAAGVAHELAVPIGAAAGDAERPALASVWARMKIADLEDRATYSDAPTIDGEIKQVALTYGLMSAYTAFVAVDSSARTAGTQGATVAVPVPVPAGVPYETTVPDGETSAVR